MFDDEIDVWTLTQRSCAIWVDAEASCEAKEAQDMTDRIGRLKSSISEDCRLVPIVKRRSRIDGDCFDSCGR
jgi:hypothetical protein